MIVNASGRTDIPAFYAEWLMQRVEAGWFYSRNPRYPSQVLRYELDPRYVDVLMMCSKNWGPMLPYLPRLRQRYRLVVHATITAYGTDLEPMVPPMDEACEYLLELSSLLGSRCVVWRYDPLVLTERYTPREQLATFDHLAARLAGKVSLCIFSFIEMYSKVMRNFPNARAPSALEREQLASGLAQIAGKRGLILQSCGTEQDFSHLGIRASGCASAQRLGEAAGCVLKNNGRKGGERRGCRCMDWRDMGAYDTCPHGCRYCYANNNHSLAKKRWQTHDPSSPMLCDQLRPGDQVRQGRMPSLLLPRQGSLLKL
ncbi:MAG: DUF1848 domain-containing protein [Desulfovibrio sp.]|nr:DUF1848 domain-containing protein [Desulfovibrio sp.]